MSVVRNLPKVRERRLAILKGDAQLAEAQKKAGKLLARERVALLFDAQSFVELDSLNADAGVITGYGLVEGNPVYMFCQDLTVNGGAVSANHARKITKVVDIAIKTGAPVVGIYDTAGAALDDGIDALNAYSVIAGKLASASGVVPTIALVLGQCGGMAASIAGIADFTIMSKHGSLFVNGPLVVSAAAGKNIDMEELAGPASSMKNGVASMIAEEDADAIAKTRELILMLPANNMDEAITPCMDDLNRESPDLDHIDSIDDVRMLLERVADGNKYLEIGEDFAASVVTALMKIDGTTVGVIANQPSKDCGRLTVYGCKKAARFATFCDSFSIPVITVVDSLGMKVTTAPQGELAKSASQLLFSLATANNARIALITGHAIGAGYICQASRATSDMVYAWPGAVISAVTPKIGAQLLFADEMKSADDPAAKRAELEERYSDDVADAVSAAVKGYIDDVIEPSKTRAMLAAALEVLSGKREISPARKHGNMPL